MTSQTGQQLLPNISRRRSNQTMNIGQLIEYQMRANFLEGYQYKLKLSCKPLAFTSCKTF